MDASPRFPGSCVLGGSEGQRTCTGFPFGFLSLCGAEVQLTWLESIEEGLDLCFGVSLQVKGIDWVAVITNYI